MKNQTDTLELAPQNSQVAKADQSPALSPINILEAAVKGGVTAENVAVVKELILLCREQRAEEAKAAFAKAFFQLRKNMPPIYADREAKDKNQNVVYTYCSEEEISKSLEPHLMSYGFAMLFGQSSANGQITVSVTLMHEQGHSETREFTVRTGSPNAMKDAAMCDAGGATTAWRHLMIKMFGLKSRISHNQDPHIAGERIAPDKAIYLSEQVKETKSDARMFLALAGVTVRDGEEVTIDHYKQILDDKYVVLVAALNKKKAKAARGE